MYSINLNTVSFKAFKALDDIDKKFVGTPDYMGLAYFWGCNDTKYYLREASLAQRRKIHKRWLDAGLELTGETEKHFEIIRDVMKIY